jgi:mannose-6-phosphate isomerase-like protein (cupin superfamily)
MTNNLNRMALACALIVSSACGAQRVEDLPSRPAKGEVENVYVEKIADDSLATAFEIWIKGGVKYHFHESHTECVYILEGDGEMVLGEESMHVKEGDFVMIPKGTPHSVVAMTRMKVLSIQTPQWVTEDRKFIEPVRRPHNE